MNISQIVLTCLLLINCFPTIAGITVGATRVIYPSDKNGVSINVDNPDTAPYLIQSWVENKGQEKSPFVVTPPLFRLDGGQQHVLRVVLTGAPPSEDKESLFWLNIKSIPSVNKEQPGNTLQLAITSRIKLIYRPVSLQGTPELSADRLIWQRHGNQLQIGNPTPFYINFYQVKVGGKNIPDITYIPPMDTVKFILPENIIGHDVSWIIINDYGGIGKEYSSRF